MVKRFVFNKNKRDTIVLVHGLYTNSGFWLSYFRLFKNFRIILFDIHYDAFLMNDFHSKESLQKLFNIDGNIIGIISHSFGTVISDIVFELPLDKIYKICPVAFSTRTDSNNFILDVANKTLLSEEVIYNNIKLVNSFVSKISNLLSCDGHIYIPTMDCYFSYDITSKKKIEFVGDHFDINVAMEDIINRLIKSKNISYAC